MIDVKYSVRLVASKRYCLYNLFHHRVILLAKQSVHLPCLLFVNFVFTSPFSINLVPIMPPRFCFGGRLKQVNFEIFQLDLVLCAADDNVSNIDIQREI